MGKTSRDPMSAERMGRCPKTYSSMVSEIRAVQAMEDEGLTPTPRQRKRSNPDGTTSAKDCIDISAWGEGRSFITRDIIRGVVISIAQALGYGPAYIEFKRFRPSLMGVIVYDDYYVDEWGLVHPCGVVLGRVLAHKGSDKVLYSVERVSGINTPFMSLEDLMVEVLYGK